MQMRRLNFEGGGAGVRGNFLDVDLLDFDGDGKHGKYGGNKAVTCGCAR